MSAADRGLIRRCSALVAAALLAAAANARAQGADAEAAAADSASAAASAPVVARDLHEETVRIAVTVKDLYGREETRQIPVTVFRPDGAGPHPLVIVNHGRAPGDKRARQGRQRYEAFSRYLVTKGFVVLLPTRVGYADTYGDFDPESTGGCANGRLEAQARAASDQVLATLAYAATLPDVDVARWVVAGQSVGGLATIAVVSRHPPGLVGAIDFAGGTGGDPDRSAGRPCNPQRLARDWEARAATAAAPMLWLYWENDEFWGAESPRLWHEAWLRGGGKAEFRQLAPAGARGHGAINFDMDHWVPLVESFLATIGFSRPGVVARPAATGFARVDQLQKLPPAGAPREAAYRQFLSHPAPRAFAIGAEGSFGWANGDWAMGRALGNCQRRRGVPCRLYAVDDDTVWTP